MHKQPLTALEIEMLGLSTSAVLEERRRSSSKDREAGAAKPEILAKPETRRRPPCRSFIDILAFAGASMAGVYVDVWLDPSGVSGKSDQQEGWSDTMS
jgi:hypothetical protein